jgi:disulfide bond formation protein DsbB
MLEAYPLGDVLAKVFHGSGECAEIGWSLFGLSIAGWALVCFVVIAVVSVAIAVRHATSR